MYALPFVDLPPLVADDYSTPILVDVPRPASNVPESIQGKISDGLWEVVEQVAAEIQEGSFALQSGNREEASLSLNASIEYHLNKAGEFHLYAAVNDWNSPELATLGSLGIRIVTNSLELGVVEAWVPFDMVDELAQLNVVANVESPIYGRL